MHKSILKLFFISTSCIYFFSIQSADAQKSLTVITSDKEKITLPYSVWHQLPLLVGMVEIYGTKEPLPVQLSAANVQKVITFLEEGTIFKHCYGEVLDALDFLLFKTPEELIISYYIAWLKNNPSAPVLSQATAEALLWQMDITTKMKDVDFEIKLDEEDFTTINNYDRTGALTLTGEVIARSNNYPITLVYGNPGNTVTTIDYLRLAPETPHLRFFGDFNNLTTLALRYSRLSELPIEGKDVPNLIHLNLSNNKFQYFPLHSHPTLNRLLLKNNEIDTCRVPLEFPQLITCDLSDNPIKPEGLRDKVKGCQDTATFTFGAEVAKY